jgi:hypothetical protein
VPNGDGGSDLFNAINTIEDARTNWLLSIIIAILNALIAVLNFILAVLNAVITFLFKVFGILVRGIRHIISDIVHGRFLHLYEDYLRLKKRIKKWFEDHLDWLLRLRKAFDDWYRNVIIPILNLIQRIRAVLAVFRIFHLKFAEKLDALLGRLEAKIIKNTLALRSKLNEVVTIIDLVLDPGLLIRDNVLLASAARSIKALGNLLGIGFSRPLTSKESAAEAQRKHLLTRAGIREDADSHPAVGLSAELLIEADKAERALAPLSGNPESRLA